MLSTEREKNREKKTIYEFRSLGLGELFQQTTQMVILAYVLGRATSSISGKCIWPRYVQCPYPQIVPGEAHNTNKVLAHNQNSQSHNGTAPCSANLHLYSGRRNLRAPLCSGLAGHRLYPMRALEPGCHRL